MKIKNKILVFSIIFLSTLTIIGAFVYFISIRQLGQENWKQELSQLIDNKKLSIQTSVNKDIALAMKWADSSVTKEFFSNPTDSTLKKLAFDEFNSYKNSFSSNTNFWANDVDKGFYSNGEFSYTVNPKNKDDYWYNMTLYETKKYNFNINYNAKLNQTKLWINAPVFKNNKPVGMVGTGIVLDAFIASAYDSVNPNVNIYFFNKKDEITGAKNKEVMTKKLTMTEYLPEFSDTIKKSLDSLNNSNKVEFKVGNKQCILTYISTLDWYMLAYVPLTYNVIRNSTISMIFYIIDRKSVV